MIGLKKTFSVSLRLLETFAFGALMCYLRNVTALLERPSGEALRVERGAQLSPAFQLSY